MKKQMLALTAIISSLCMYTANAQTSPKQKPAKTTQTETVKPAAQSKNKEVKNAPKAKSDARQVDPKKKK